MADYSVIGKGFIRKDALDKVTGRAMYAADVQPGCPFKNPGNRIRENAKTKYKTLSVSIK